MDYKSNRYCVIMCGGAGTRFWPFSRESLPKQFIDFFGTGQTLLQLTVDRIRPLIPEENIILLTNEMYADTIRTQLPWIPADRILFEPARRDTAPGLLWAAHHIASHDAEASFVALPSDHVILKETSFHNTIIQGFEFVEDSDRILAFGIKPSSPNTSYCYLQKGVSFRNFRKVSKIKTIAERPDERLAEIFMRSGEFLWNAGIYMSSAGSIVKAFQQHAPDIASIFDIGRDMYKSLGEATFIKENFPKSTSLPIENAIMEKADNAYVMETDIGWSDLSTWKALYDMSPKNKDGNVTQKCRSLLYDSKGCIVSEENDKVVVVSGLENYIVADTHNALLVCPIDAEQKIRNIVNDIRDCFGQEYV
ncbi:MAG: mannose-1-phosphate guanylyltransferase [Muribaculum sp.]|nr:mannose-1-phosphate guanylyltransferase [Muribaculum sp.]